MGIVMLLLLLAIAGPASAHSAGDRTEQSGVGGQLFGNFGILPPLWMLPPEPPFEPEPPSNMEEACRGHRSLQGYTFAEEWPWMQKWIHEQYGDRYNETQLIQLARVAMTSRCLATKRARQE